MIVDALAAVLPPPHEAPEALLRVVSKAVAAHLAATTVDSAEDATVGTSRRRSLSTPLRSTLSGGARAATTGGRRDSWAAARAKVLPDHTPAERLSNVIDNGVKSIARLADETHTDKASALRALEGAHAAASQDAFESETFALCD